MASIRKRTLDSGRHVWLVDYRDNSGHRRSKQFGIRKEAEAWRAKVLVDVSQGVHTPDSKSITVADAGQRWLAKCEQDRLEVSTVRSYRGILSHHILPMIGEIRLSKLTAPRVEQWVDDLLESRSRPLTKKIVGTLSMIVGDAQRRGFVNQNVVRSVKVRTSTRDRKEIEIPTKAEMQLMLARVSDDWRPFLLTAMFSGLRASELRGLRWIDVDFKKAKLSVRQRVDQWKNFGPPKTKAGLRDVPLPPIVVDELRRWRLRCPKGEWGLVFPNGAGNPESHANLLNRFFWPLQIECGLIDGHRERDGETKPVARFSLHALRHAAASLLIEQGLNSKRIQTIMGHSSIAVTMDTYGHLFDNPEEDRRIMERVEAQFFHSV